MITKIISVVVLAFIVWPLFFTIMTIIVDKGQEESWIDAIKASLYEIYRSADGYVVLGSGILFLIIYGLLVLIIS